MHPNVIELVVKKYRCIGCGACAGMCPASVLNMDFNKSGCYQPYEIPGCLDKCGICLKVCPFHQKDLDEIKISNKLYKTDNSYKEIGNFIDTYEFHIKDEKTRLESASGGAGFYLLSELLKQKKVDKIIAVKPNNDPEKLFKFSLFDSITDLKNSKKSAYYPVNMEEILKYILKNDFNYAVTALPCFAKAIRLAQKINPKIRKRVKFIIGLVCGQMKSKNFNQTLSDLSFRTHKKLKNVDFRYKVEGRPSSNFAFKFTSTDDHYSVADWSSVADCKTSPSVFWTSRAFTPFACNNCNDTFAICADVVLMDAWLPNFIKDWRGHSLIITRNNQIDEILKNADQDIVYCKKFPVKQVYASQNQVVKNKAAFFYGNKNIFVTTINNIKLKIQTLSNYNYKANKKEIEILLLKLKKIEKFYRFIKLPNIILNKIIRIIKGW